MVRGRAVCSGLVVALWGLGGLVMVGGIGPAFAGEQAQTQPSSEEHGHKHGDANINDPYAAIKTEDDVEVWVERFSRESREVAAARGAILDALHLKPGMDVADVGAGTGLFVGGIAGRVAPGGTVYAVDVVEPFLEHINKVAAEQGVTNIKTVLCTQDSSELPPNAVDLVFICDTYHHFEHPKSTMQSIHRALRKDGEVVLIEFDRVEGKSREWIMGHVRAGQNEFVSEIESVGFEVVDRPKIEGLQETFFVRFRKKG